MSSYSSQSPLMILGTCSGAGKSLMTAAICRVLKRKGEYPIPFKGQNMSNNAWVDEDGGEMAYSQAMQAWAAGIKPSSAMNPVLLKPQGDSTSEVIHLGKSVGITEAKSYYEEWFDSGWEAICTGLNKLKESNQSGRFVLEGAGSPVEVNLKHRDLTNLRLAKYINANCILVADIERGGVFAQIIGTIALLSPCERKLIKGIIINRFRGDRQLFNQGKDWLEEETGIPVLGIMPWLNEVFPPEDSLDLLERKGQKYNAEIHIAVIKLPSLSNFSDLDPLEAEKSVKLIWVKPGDQLGSPDAVIIPGSKQTIRDLNILHSTGLGMQIKNYANQGGNIFGICGGLQMLGRKLEDPHFLEGSYKSNNKEVLGLNLIPIKTIFSKEKVLINREVKFYWPASNKVNGFELHHGHSKLINLDDQYTKEIAAIPSIGWVTNKRTGFNVAGTYLHGIFENGSWRRQWLNNLREKKRIPALITNVPNHFENRDKILDLLADEFVKNIKLERVI